MDVINLCKSLQWPADGNCQITLLPMLNPNQEKDCWRQYSSHFCVHSRKGNTIRIGQHKCNTGKASFKWLAWYYITLQIMFCYFIFSKWILENTSIKEENICIYGYLCNASYGTQITNFCLTVGEKQNTGWFVLPFSPRLFYANYHWQHSILHWVNLNHLIFMSVGQGFHYCRYDCIHQSLRAYLHSD